MSIPKAAEKFEVYEGSLKSVLMWDKVDLTTMASNSLEMKLALLQNEGSNGNHLSSQEFLKEGHLHVASARTYNRHHVLKRARLTVGSNDPQEESNDDSVDFEKMLQNLHGETVARKMAFRPSSATDAERLHSSPVNDSLTSIKEELPDAGTELKTNPIMSAVITNCSGSASSCSLATLDQDRITTVPLQALCNESNDEKNCSNGVIEVSVPQNASPLTKFTHLTHIHELHWKKPTESTSSDCDAVSDLELQFQQTEQDLANCQSINVRLQNELESMQNENLLLKEELNTRDFHLVHLAEDFFKLHSQFKQLAEQFQLILNETQNSLSQNFPGHHSR